MQTNCFSLVLVLITINPCCVLTVNNGAVCKLAVIFKLSIVWILKN